MKIRGLLLQDTCFVQLVLVSSRTALYLVKEPASLLDQIQSIDTTTQERWRLEPDTETRDYHTL